MRYNSGWDDGTQRDGRGRSLRTRIAAPLFFLLLVSLAAPYARAQQYTTTVTSTVVDENGIPYHPGSVKAQLVASSGAPVTGQPTVTDTSQAECTAAGLGTAPCQMPFAGTVGPMQFGSTSGPYVHQTVPSASAVGFFTLILQDNSHVSPAGTQWLFTICQIQQTPPPPLGPSGNVCFSVGPLTITGASQDISTQVLAASILLCPYCNGTGGTGGLSYVQAPENTFVFNPSLDQNTLDGQFIGTCAVAALGQGNTSQCPYTDWLSSLALIGPYPAPGSDVAPVNTATSHNGAPNGPGQTGTTNAVDVPPGATAIAGLCSSANASCFIEISNLGVTDSKGDTFSPVTFTGANSSLLYATNMVGGSTTFSLRDGTPVSGNYQDTGQVLVVTNFGSFDGPAKTLSFGSTTGNPTTTTTTYTTSVAGDLLAVFLGAPGNGGSCAAGSKITVQVGSALASYINTNVDGGGVYSVSGIFVIGAPTAGTYTISATMTGVCDPGSMNVLAIEPAVAGPLAAPPTVRQFAESDYNYLFGLPPSEANSFSEAGNLVPLCNVLPTATYTLAYNNGCWGPEAPSTGTVTGTGTANTMTKFTGASAVGNSSVTDDGTAPVRSPNGLNTATGPIDQEYTADATVTAGQAVCVDGTTDAGGRPNVAPCSHTAAQPGAGFAGVAYNSVSSGATVQVCWATNCSALFDNQSTALNEAILSTTTDGDLHDTGAQTATAGQPNFGVLKANTGAGTASPVGLTDTLAQNPKGGGGGGSSNYKFAATTPVTVATTGKNVTYACPTCSTGGGLSGMTAGQVPIAATATTVTSSKALVGTDAGIASAGTISSTPTLACSDANGGLTTSGCPSTASIPSASTNLKTAAPIQIPGSAVSFSPDPAVCTGDPGIVNCTPQRDPIAGQIYGVYFDPGETPTCTDITDSQSNVITTVVPAGLGYLTYNYFIPTTTAPDTFTTHCSSNNEIMKMTMTQYFNASGVESTTATSADSCGTVGIPCTSTVTTGQPGDLLMSFTNMDGTNYPTGPFGGYGPLTVSPQGVLYSQSAGYGADNFSASAAPTGGTYSGSGVNAGNTNGWTRSAVFGIIPATPLVGTAVVESQTSVTTLTSIAFSQTQAVGNTMVLSVNASSMTTPNSCLPVSSLGNVFVNMDGVDNNTNRHYYAPITVGGSSDTISFPAACSNSSAGAELAVAMQMKSSFTVTIKNGTAGSNIGTYGGTTAADNATLILLPTNFSNAVAYTFSPGLDVLSSSSTINSYALGIGQLSPPGSYTYIANGYNGFSMYTGFLLYPTVQPTYPQQPRVSALPDLGAPVTTLTLPFASTLNFDAAHAHGWDVTLTGNVTATTFAGAAGGQNYEFTFCGGQSPGLLVAAPSNVSVVNWPASLPAGCSSYAGTYDGATSTLTMRPQPGVVQPCVSAASPAVCGSSSLGYVAVPAAATSLTVNTTVIGPNPIINLTNDDSATTSTLLGVTANTTPQLPVISAYVPLTSFTITLPSAPVTNPDIYQFDVANPISSDSPPIIGGLVLHYDANAQGYANSAKVLSLADISGSGSNGSPISTGASFATGAINSRAAIDFPGSSAGRYTFPATAALTNSTVFVEFQQENSAATSALLSGNTNSVVFSANYQAAGVLHLTVPGSAEIGSSTAVLVVGTWYQANYTYDAASGAWAFRIGEAAEGSGTTTASVTSGESAVGWGRAEAGLDSYLNVAEMLVYNRVLSAAEITAVETWLHVKYGN